MVEWWGVIGMAVFSFLCMFLIGRGLSSLGDGGRKKEADHQDSDPGGPP